MESNPYESPRFEQPEQVPAGGSLVRSVAGIVAGGALVDYLGTQVFLWGIWRLASSASMSGVPISVSPFGMYNLTAQIGGLVLSMLGGFTAASVARRNPVTHAVAAVSLAHLLVMPSWFLAGAQTRPVSWLGLSGCFVLAVLGGKWAARRSVAVTSSEEFAEGP